MFWFVEFPQILRIDDVNIVTHEIVGSSINIKNVFIIVNNTVDINTNHTYVKYGIGFTFTSKSIIFFPLRFCYLNDLLFTNKWFPWK